MLPELEALMILQDRDRRLLGLRQDLERIPREIERAHERLHDEQLRVERGLAGLRDCEVAIKKLELDAGTRRTTIERLKRQQFETRKNEEYQALAHEITRYTADVDQLETRELELMEDLDRLRAELDAARAALATVQVGVNDEVAQFEARRGTIESELAGLEGDRGVLAAAVPESVRPLYERLLKSKGGSALAPVTSTGQCGGCHMKLTAATLINVQSEAGIVQCENCARILHPGD